MICYYSVNIMLCNALWTSKINVYTHTGSDITRAEGPFFHRYRAQGQRRPTCRCRIQPTTNTGMYNACIVYIYTIFTFTFVAHLCFGRRDYTYLFISVYVYVRICICIYIYIYIYVFMCYRLKAAMWPPSVAMACYCTRGTYTLQAPLL